MQPNKGKRDKTVAARQIAEKELLLEKFKKMPVLQIALQQAGSIARSTYYNWRDNDEEFRKNADAAINEGTSFITELSESKLISLVNKEHFPAIMAWLKAHHAKYTTRVEVEATLNVRDESLSPEQLETVSKALKAVGVDITKPNEPDHGTA
jgi:hypothetical protein